ncbi:MAG: DNA primase regulatory subunit PriL [Methanoregula sp.]|nr:DNA primase regulatory subunit PriL [Methanoregula sp.]
MVYVPSAKESAHFPVLKRAQDHVRIRFTALESLLKDPKGEILAARAADRIQEAISPRKVFNPTVPGSAEDEIAVYALSRIMASCINDRQLIDRLTRYESDRAYYFLVNEEEWNQNYKQEDGEYSRLCIALAGELGIRITQDRMPLVDYVELVAPLHEDRFRLVNRRLDKGSVEIRKDERYELLRERIRLLLRRDLPHKVPTSICERLAPRATQLKRAYQDQMVQQFGEIQEHAFPPCIHALITALAAGTNLTHAGRFGLTTFIHAIGMDTRAIAELYGRSPDFDAEKTMYQVEHITGRGGSSTEYSTPACAAMRTTGLCLNRDALCERVNHPLSYYKVKKREAKKEARKPEESGSGEMRPVKKNPEERT